MIDNLKQKIFLKTFLITLVPTFLALILFGFFYVYKSGDLRVEDVVHRQKNGDFVIFGPAINPNHAFYKLRMYEELKPDIVALGTSRVMQFRDKFFSQQFLNMGGSFDSVSGLQSCIQAMLEIHKPKAVIIGIDFWWFNEQWLGGYTGKENTSKYDIQSIFKPFHLFLDGSISVDELFFPFTSGFRSTRYGIQAQINDAGFGIDGSYYYAALVTGMSKPHDKNFTNTLGRIINRNNRFEKTADISTKMVDDFVNVYRILQKNEVEVFVFITPLAAKIVDEMQKSKNDYQHLFKLESSLQARNVPVADYTDLRNLGSTDCEFIDGFHGGDISYARILADMEKSKSMLKKYLNLSLLSEDIKKFSGLAMIPDTRVTSTPEVDFLNLSCPKKHTLDQ